MGIGRRADGRARVRAHPLLVDDDRRGQVVERVDLGPWRRPHEPLDERRVRLIDQALRLGGDRLEYERALPRSGHAGEDGQLPLRDVEADVAQVVLARSTNLDRAPIRHGPILPHARGHWRSGGPSLEHRAQLDLRLSELIAGRGILGPGDLFGHPVEHLDAALDGSPDLAIAGDEARRSGPRRHHDDVDSPLQACIVHLSSISTLRTQRPSHGPVVPLGPRSAAAGSRHALNRSA